MKFNIQQLNKEDLQLIDRLKEIRLLDPTLDFQHNSKTRILNSLPEQIAAENYPKNNIWQPLVWKSALISILVIFLLVGSGYAAQNSLPGEILYPLKKIIENTRLNLALTPEYKLRLRMETARTRLTEAEKLLINNKEPELIFRTMLDYQQMMENINEMIAANNFNSMNMELADMANYYNQIIANCSEEIKNQLQLQQRDREQNMQSQEQYKLNQELGNSDNLNVSAETDSDANSIQQQKKTGVKADIDTGVLLAEPDKNGISQANKP